MGQYHVWANLTKRETVKVPHAGVKQRELFHNNGAAALVPLLSVSNDRGGGDFRMNNGETALNEAILGRWVGDVVVLVGDYAEPDDVSGYAAPDWPDETIGEVYDLASLEPGGLVDANDYRRKQGKPELVEAQLFTDISEDFIRFAQQQGDGSVVGSE